MRIALLCGTERGVRFLDRLCSLLASAEILVLSFPEEPHEPRFLETLREVAVRRGVEMELIGKGAKRYEALERFRPDVLLAVSWRFYIPPGVYERANTGRYVFHDSLLPRYRGFAPTVWAMINGEDTCGVSLLTMAEDIDAGALVAQKRVAIGPKDTIREVLERVTQTYLELLEENIPQLETWQEIALPQDQGIASYCCKRLPEDNLIDWRMPAAHIYNLIRAVTHPYPGAFTWLGQKKISIWAAQRTVERVYVGAVPGRVVEILPGSGVVVLAGDGALMVTSVQLEGADVVPAELVLNRLSMTLGEGRAHQHDDPW